MLAGLKWRTFQGANLHLLHLCEWPHPPWRSDCSGSVWWQIHPGPVYFSRELKRKWSKICKTDYNRPWILCQTVISYGDLLFLGTEGFLKVFMFLQKSFNAVQRVTQIFIQQESLWEKQFEMFKSLLSVVNKIKVLHDSEKVFWLILII